MPNDRFTVTEYERTIVWGDEGDDDYTDETEEGDTHRTDARGVVELVASGCWDQIVRRCDAYTMRGASRRTLRAKLATTYRLHLYRGR